MKRMVVGQFLMCREVIGFDGEVLLVKRLWAGRGTKIRMIRFSLLLRGKSAQPIFRHTGRGVPERQLDRTPLVNPKRAVSDLESSR
jgi:hypothetical protein